ncbi:MAG: hypothetical protein R6V10_01535 [bacterium]
MGKRPIGVIILAALHILGGLAMTLGLVAALRGDAGSAGNAFQGGPPGYVLGTIALMSAVNLAAGAGLIMGRNWGWCLSLFFLVLLALRNVEGLLLVPVFSQFRTAEEINAAYSSYVVALLVQGLIMVYYFRSNVLEFFGLEDSSRPRLAVWVVLAAMAYLTLNLVLDLKLVSLAGAG